MGLSVLEYVDKKRRMLSEDREHVLLGCLLNKSMLLDIYKVMDNDGNNWTVRADEEFFEEYNKKNKYLYDDKEYYINYVTNKDMFFIERKEHNKTKRAYKKSSVVHQYVFNRDNNECFNCGSKEKLTIDHIDPISKSCDDSAYNKVTMCEKCNMDKNDSQINSKHILNELVRREMLKEEMKQIFNV